MATDADTKELGLIESRSENAEQSWLGMFVGFVAINQFSMDSDFRACVSEKFCHPRDFVSQSLGYPRCGVQRDGSARRSVHKKSDAVHHLVGNRRFPIDSRRWLPETWRSWSRDDSAKKWRLTSCECEFEDELQGCKKPMSRDLAGLMTHENSGVAGHSATADVDENSDVAGELIAQV